MPIPKLTPGQLAYRDREWRKKRENRAGWLDRLEAAKDLHQALEECGRYLMYAGHPSPGDKYFLPGVDHEASKLREWIQHIGMTEMLEHHRTLVEYARELHKDGTLPSDEALAAALAKADAFMAGWMRGAHLGRFAEAYETGNFLLMVPPPETLEVAPPSPDELLPPPER
jgi:hypothetical protein